VRVLAVGGERVAATGRPSSTAGSRRAKTALTGPGRNRSAATSHDWPLTSSSNVGIDLFVEAQLDRAHILYRYSNIWGLVRRG
jgi:hypothetical protein